MKLIARRLIGLLLLLVVLVVGLAFFVDSALKKAVERGGTHALGVETRLADASLAFVSGEFALTGLGIANPSGFDQPDFFSLASARLNLPLSSLLEQHIKIPALSLEGVAIDLERNSKGTNYGEILDNLARFESAPGAASEGKGTKEGKPVSAGGKTYQLQRLVIRNVRASVNLLPAGGELTRLSLAIPEIVVEDLGSDMSLAEMCALVVKVVIQAAIGAGQGVVPDELLADLRGRLDGLGGEARARLDQELEGLAGKLQGQAKKLGPDAEKALQEAGDKLGGKLDGLLKKKN